MLIVTHKTVKRLLPRRRREAHKGDFGRVLIIGGSVGYTGAPRLAALAALACGSGLIEVAVPAAVYPIVASGLLEPMVFPMPDWDGKLSTEALPLLLEKMRRCDACLLGIGMGRSGQTEQLTQRLLLNSPCPIVLDADGINALQGHIDVLRETACPVILTPHEGEFCRLVGVVDDNRLRQTQALARQTGKIILRKGHRTLICDRSRFALNRTGNPGMATGGSGDVLGGLILSLLGQGLAPFEAAAVGAWLHGAAGDLCASRIGEYGMTPGDIIRAVPRLLK